MKAAEVIEDGKLSPLVISLQIFLLITSTKPPRSTTSLYNRKRSSTCLAIMGIRETGVPKMWKVRKGQYLLKLLKYLKINRIPISLMRALIWSGAVGLGLHFCVFRPGHTRSGDSILYKLRLMWLDFFNIQLAWFHYNRGLGFRS